MGTNLYAPNGLRFSRNVIGASPTYQANQYNIKDGYSGSAIAIGDLVKTGTSGNLGYVVISAAGETGALGVFAGVLPYYDATQQATSHGLNGSYQTGANPNADIPCLVISDPYATFIAQVYGVAWSEAYRGKNIDILTGTNGVPNTAGQSTLALDGASINTTSTLPFRILGPAGVTGGPNDPANTNCFVEVRMNTSELNAATGI